MKTQSKEMMAEHSIDNVIWKYDITWEIKGKLVGEALLEALNRACIDVKVMEADETKITFKVCSVEQLNITKWQTALQKKVVADLKWKPDDIELNSIMSHSPVCAQEDIRLTKLIDGIREVDYYDLEEGLTDEDCNLLKAYLKNQHLGVIEQKGQIFLIDCAALKKEINLNCFECTKRHQYGCCCGSPCAMSEKNMALLDRHMVSVEEALKKLDEQQYDALMSKGGFVSANGTIKAFDGHCAFLIQHEGVYKCMAHKYALDEQIPIYALCPLSCLMYPLEIMELITDKNRKMYLITSAVEEQFAVQFSRWGSYTSLDVELRCIRKEAADEGFKLEAYKPVYQVNQGLLSHEFGERLVQGICYLLEK